MWSSTVGSALHHDARKCMPRSPMPDLTRNKRVNYRRCRGRQASSNVSARRRSPKLPQGRTHRSLFRPFRPIGGNRGSRLRIRSLVVEIGNYGDQAGSRQCRVVRPGSEPAVRADPSPPNRRDRLRRSPCPPYFHGEFRRQVTGCRLADRHGQDLRSMRIGAGPSLPLPASSARQPKRCRRLSQTVRLVQFVVWSLYGGRGHRGCQPGRRLPYPADGVRADPEGASVRKHAAGVVGAAHKPQSEGREPGRPADRDPGVGVGRTRAGRIAHEGNEERSVVGAIAAAFVDAGVDPLTVGERVGGGLPQAEPGPIGRSAAEDDGERFGPASTKRRQPDPVSASALRSSC